MPDSNATSFESFVQDNLNHHGFVLTEEEEKLVQKAIENTLQDDKVHGKINFDEKDNKQKKNITRDSNS